MASPFRYFRKHTKVFMAVAVVLLMFIWVVGSAMSGGGPGGNDNPGTASVATWNGGSLDQNQLNALVAHRLITDEFLKRVFAQGGGRSEYDLPIDIPWRGLLLGDQQRDAIEQIVIQTDVEADLAKRAGITVSDDLISDYIAKMGLGKLNSAQLEQILASVGNGNPRTSEGIVMGTLRKMLAAYFYTRMYADPALVVLPHQRWQDWKQVNDRISLQVAVLPVDKFLPEVPEPNDDQLKALFNDFKEFDPGRRVDVGGRVLPSPDPGFAEPQRVRLQYLKGSVADLAEKLMDKVSETDIAYYYEQNKDTDFLKMDVPASPADAGESAPESTAPATPSEETPAAESPAEPADPTSGEAATPAEAPAVAAPAETPAAPAEPANTDAEAAPAAEEATGQGSSDVRPASPFRLVSFQDAPDAPAPTETPATEPETPPASAPASEPAVNAPAPAETTEPAPVAAAVESEPTGSVTTPAASAAADKYEPLDNVRDEIRRELARDMAVKELDRIMGESMAQLQTEFNAYGIAVIEATEAGKKTPKPPAKLADLQWLADKNALVYEKMSPLTAPELYDTPVGKAIGTATQEMTVAQAAFYALKPFEPFMASELEGDVYIVMKTEDIPRRVPDFKEVRDRVAAAWKQREAAKLAEKKAKELATEIQKSNTPFDQFFFADRGFEVIKETALFSWLNYPTGRAGFGSLPSLSDIPELKGIGPQFMETVFGLADNETVGVLNYDQTAAYVVRIARKQWSEDELKKLFLEESESWPGGRDMLFKHASIFNNAVENDMFTERAGLKFDEKWLQERQKRQQR
ncbi:MAG: hypothetical protein JNL18_12725 [Planctomycetaceae bacterium]|nr:hypothetical protein [Planctomycetaceae bacterium]